LSNEILIERALRRQEVFRNLPKYLGVIKTTVQKLDPKARAYLFGSVAENRNNYSSDIDILILTNLKPAIIHSELWKAGIKEPFEIHIESKQNADFYKTKAKMLRI
jgi:predicted nucleotidyltransferase